MTKRNEVTNEINRLYDLLDEVNEEQIRLTEKQIMGGILTEAETAQYKLLTHLQMVFTNGR